MHYTLCLWYYRGNVIGDNTISGTLAGGQSARDTNLKRHGADWYKRIGSNGGKASNTGGFAGDPERAKLLAKLGGRPPKSGKVSMYRKQEIIQARKDLAALERKRQEQN